MAATTLGVDAAQTSRDVWAGGPGRARDLHCPLGLLSTGAAGGTASLLVIPLRA